MKSATIVFMISLLYVHEVLTLHSYTVTQRQTDTHTHLFIYLISVADPDPFHFRLPDPTLSKTSQK